MLREIIAKKVIIFIFIRGYTSEFSNFFILVSFKDLFDFDSVTRSFMKTS